MTVLQLIFLQKSTWRSYNSGCPIAKSLAEVIGTTLSVCNVPNEKSGFTIHWKPYENAHVP